MHKQQIDKIFLGIVVALVVIGIVMFTSASLGILAKNQSKFYSVIFSQITFGLVGGAVAFILALKINYKFWRKYSLVVFVLSIILTSLVFVPHLGSSHGGATRWVDIFGVSFQPVEFLKIGFIIYFASWLSSLSGRVDDLKFTILPLVVLVGIIAVLLLKQPDTKNLILIILTASAMLLVSGVKPKYILGFAGLAVLGLLVLLVFKPYLMQRVKTFINPTANSRTSSYQLQQSQIALGSGSFFGRGLGQSIQKFNYLPEPQGDSIFAVIGEELGFFGCTILILIYVAFALRGYKIAYYAPDSFAKLMVVGIITLITAQSFMNIASIVGVFPLTGVPLVFISQGGTALLLSIGMAGLVLNISGYQKR